MALQSIECEKPYKLVKARHGWFLVNPNDFYLGLAIEVYGEYGELEWEMLNQLLPAGKDAIEVGANIGSHTVSLAQRLAQLGRRLLAVEPQPAVFQNLCANLALNGLFNVAAENVACSDAAGWVTFKGTDPFARNNSGGVSMREDGLGDARVRCVTLDELLPTDFQPGLLKIDVEGFEQKVLEGAVQLIERHRPIIYVENDRRERSQALIEWLWARRYKLWWHIPPLFNPNNFAAETENRYGAAASFNMLAIPDESPTVVQGLLKVEDSTHHPLTRPA